jgi:FOG: Ankyrin repeat
MDIGKNSLFVKRRLLHDAVRQGNVCQLRYLLKRRGENVNTLDDKRQTALMIAASTKYKSRKIQKIVLELIMECAPRLNVKDSRGWTAFIHACSANNMMAVALLLSEHVQDLCLDAQDIEGMTGLMYAVHNGNLKMVTLILSPWKQFGLSQTLENKAGENVMDLASKENHVDIMKTLKYHGFHAQIESCTTNQRARTVSRGVKVEHKATPLRRVKSSIPTFNRKNNKTSVTSDTSSIADRHMNDFHQLFDLYTQQSSPSYKESAKTPGCLNDQDDVASLDSLASFRSFRSVGYRRVSQVNEEGGGLDHLFQHMGISDSSRQSRTRRTGASLVVPNFGRSRKISAPCFPSAQMMRLNSRRDFRPIPF